MEDIDFNIEEFLEKPSTPIEPIDNFNLLYIVSHVPYAMHYGTLKMKGIKNERIKAVVNAEKWNEFRRYFNSTCRDINNKVREEKFHWLDEFGSYQKKCKEQEQTIQKKNERIAELETKINAISNVLVTNQTETKTENNEDKQTNKNE